jgi:hypothetical protein
VWLAYSAACRAGNGNSVPVPVESARVTALGRLSAVGPIWNGMGPWAATPPWHAIGAHRARASRHQASSFYIGNLFYFKLIESFGCVVAITATTCRKVL